MTPIPNASSMSSSRRGGETAGVRLVRRGVQSNRPIADTADLQNPFMIMDHHPPPPPPSHPDHHSDSKPLSSPLSPSAAGILKPIRRRNRMINSCLECRKRKLKCSKTSPSCVNCIKSGRDCLYIGPRLDEASQLRLAEIKEKQGSLERQLERDVANNNNNHHDKNNNNSAISGSRPNSKRHMGLGQHIIDDDGCEDDHSEERDMETTPLVALDLTYDEDADSTDDMIDLGIQIGRMRITERIGGLSRPRLSEEISAGLSGQQQRPAGTSPPASGYGPPPGMTPRTGIDSLSDAGASDISIPDFLRPSSEYLAPTSGYFFGQVVATEQPSILSFLPPRASADRLMRQYYVAVHPIVPCTHRPSLEAIYAAFWEEIDGGYEPRASTQAVIFAALFSSVVSMNENDVICELGGYTKGNWTNSLKIGTETALSKANFLRTTRVETMQAFVMYMLPLCRGEVSRAHSVLVGAAVRMAESMGLHRDGEAYGLTPLETHIRRLIWHQLCFLDIRTCEAQGPKPVIRREDYDTKLPLNCDENEITNVGPPPLCSPPRWTTNTLAIIRFENCEMMRIVWQDRRRLEQRRITLTAILAKIERFRRRMSENYDSLVDQDQPLQRYAKIVMYLLTYRLHVMVLHPYHSNAASPMPTRLGSLLITSGIMIVELAISLETNPLFAHWSWYLGAYFQYQIALLLATEVYFRPRCREADRIWACLDYVFGLDRRLSPDAKARSLLLDIQNRTAKYVRLRRIRAPTNVTRAMPAPNAVEGLANAYYHGFGPTGPGIVGSSFSSVDGGGGSVASYSLPYAGGAGNPKSEHGPASSPMMMQHSGGGGDGGVGFMEMSMPMQQMVYAGASDGQVLWSLPPAHHDSPGSSDTGSCIGYAMQPQPMSQQQKQKNSEMSGGRIAGSNVMDTIDWDTINSLFPSDPLTGGLNIQGYNHDANFNFLDWNS